MKKLYFIILCCLICYVSWAQTESSSRICASCIGGEGGGDGVEISCPFTQTILHVDASKTSSGDGKTWGTAKRTLQEALFIANQCDKVYVIRVAQGVYKATTGSNRNNSFFIGNKFNIIGGYPPGGGSPDPAVYPTILDGDIGTAGVHNDNSYHVLVVAGFTGDITIEGLQIRNGYANGTGDLHLYDDVYLARSQAAGLYVDDVDGTVIIRNCAFSNNRATGAGGAITAPSASLHIFQNIFYNNAANIGAVMWNYNGSFTVKNSTIHHNGENGVLGNVAISNCIIWGNDKLMNSSSTITTEYCIVQGGRSGTGIISEDPQLFNTADGDGADNIWFTDDDGLRLKLCSPAINRGNNALGYDGETDIAGNTRIYDVNIDIGAYEYPLPVIPGSSNLLPTVNTNTETFVYGGTTALTNNCRMIGSVQPNGINPVNGEIRAGVFIENEVPQHNGKYYVARHYSIMHSVLKPEPTARITLYFTQDDFANYNTAVGSKKDHLPVDALDAANIAKLRVNQFHGGSPDGTGLPATYESGFTFIDPADEDIEWHAGKGGDPGYWTVSFDVTGFSGFFITAGASSALPVEWIDFTASLFEQTVQLNWQTASEQNSSHFTVQRSTNGTDYENTGSVNAAGTSSNVQAYSWSDDVTALKNVKTLYYRLLQVDTDGKHSYSKVIQLRLQGDNAWLRSVVNPVSDKICFTVHTGRSGVLYTRLLDVQGRVIVKTNHSLSKGVNNIQFSAIYMSRGIYLLELVQEGKRIVTKLVKN